MKKTIMYLKSVAFCGMMAALFIGCGNNSDSDDAPESKSTSVSKEEEENKVDSLAVIAELNAEFESVHREYRGLVGQIHRRNVMEIKINQTGQIATVIDGNWHICPIESIKNRTIMFLTPCRESATRQERRVVQDTLDLETVAPEESASQSLPCLKEDYTHPEIEELFIGDIGNIPVSKGLVLLLKNNESSLAIHNKVKKELVDAILEMRDIQSKKYFGRSYFQLTEKERQAVGKMIPMSIFETTPAELYESAPEPPEPETEPVFDFEENFEVVSEEEIIASEADYYE